MPMLDVKEQVVPKDFQRMELRSLVNLAGEPISHYWPMKTFIHHNPLHGLEHLSFDEAIKQGTRFSEVEAISLIENTGITLRKAAYLKSLLMKP